MHRPRRATIHELDHFDVDAAFDPSYDFDHAFADLDGPVPVPAAAVRAPRSRIAFAAAVTAVVLPLLVADNLGATADEGAGPDIQEVIESVVDDVPAEITAVRARIVVEEATIPALVTTTTAPATTVTEASVAPVTTAKPTTSTTARPTTTTTAKPTTTTTAKPAPVRGDPDNLATWEELAECESGGNWATNTGNGYYGGLQFSQASWENVGGTGLPHESSKSVQIEMGKKLQARQGWAAWPTCSRQLGYIN